MTALITLLTAGTDTGPFDLYSNLDAFTTPFETNISKASLLSGFTSPNVPNYATTIRCYSKGLCTNYVEIVLAAYEAIPCGAEATSGGIGITESDILLSSLGGVLIFEFNGQGVPDKLEIIHNGVKKATSGMTVANSGPFDNVYGTEPSNVIPFAIDTQVTDQFIGAGSSIAGGIIPTRNSAFFTDTGIPGITVEAGYQQLIWWKYTPADYLITTIAQVRVTGPSGTSWDLKRLCPE